MNATTETVRLTEAGLRKAVDALRDELMERPTRGELEVLRLVYERILAARYTRCERAA